MRVEATAATAVEVEVVGRPGATAEGSGVAAAAAAAPPAAPRGAVVRSAARRRRRPRPRPQQQQQHPSAAAVAGPGVRRCLRPLPAAWVAAAGVVCRARRLK